MIIVVCFAYRREDSGLLVYKDHLPVSEVAIGDTNRPGSDAKLTVGPLHCHGDRESKHQFKRSTFLSFRLSCHPSGAFVYCS